MFKRPPCAKPTGQININFVNFLPIFVFLYRMRFIDFISDFFAKLFMFLIKYFPLKKHISPFTLVKFLF